jgi:hypothetical protein
MMRKAMLIVMRRCRWQLADRGRSRPAGTWQVAGPRMVAAIERLIGKVSPQK